MECIISAGRHESIKKFILQKDLLCYNKTKIPSSAVPEEEHLCSHMQCLNTFNI